MLFYTLEIQINAKYPIKIPNELKTIVDVFLGKCLCSIAITKNSTGRDAASKYRRQSDDSNVPLW